MKKLWLHLPLLVLSVTLLAMKPGFKQPRSIYQLTIYHYTTPEQEKRLDAYLQTALLPALHRQQIKYIGVFKAHANDTAQDKTLYVLTPLTSLNAVTTVQTKLNADKDYQTAGADYINAAYNHSPYNRIETILLEAFPLAPQLTLPDLMNDRRERVYELRSYESATEKILVNKIKMFNEGDEIGLFKKLHFNAAFYGEVVAGSKMPNLMYLTCHENKAAREANWKAFGESAEWKKLSSMPEYQNNVSHIDINFLYPAEYSDF
jgi:hypothetical protein